MDIRYVSATPELKTQMCEQWSSNASDFIRFDDDVYSLVVIVEGPIGLIVAKKRALAEPLSMLQEVFIDLIEVQPAYQRQGIGTTLVERVIEWTKEAQVAQVRAWSEAIRHEALMLWNKLGFAFSQVDFQREDGKHYGFYVAKRL